VASPYEYGLIADEERGLLGTLANMFSPMRRPIRTPAETTYMEADGALYPQYKSATYGEPEFGFQYMPAYRAISGLLSDPEVAVDAAAAMPEAMRQMANQQVVSALDVAGGGSGELVDEAGNQFGYDPLAVAAPLAPAGVAAAKAGGATFGAMGGRVKPPTKTELDPLGYGAVKFDRAVPDIDVRVTGTNQPNLPRKAATIEDLQGKVLMPVYWDKSSNRGLLTGIDETDLARPVLLEGGPDFMVGPAAQAERAMLASGQGIVSTLSNRARKLAEETGKDIVGTTITMAPDAVDFTTFMSRALAEQLPAASITKKAMKSFDVEMKKVDKKWPGVNSENLGDYLSSASSDVRKKFVRTMDKKPFYEAGFPSVGKTRVAVTEPDLVDVPAGRAGFALGQIDLDAPLLLNPKVPHETYPVQMVGDYLGGFKTPIPQSLLWRDAIKGMEGRTYFDKKLGREVPWSDATRAYTLKTQLPGQLVDQELVDALMQYSLLGK